MLRFPATARKIPNCAVWVITGCAHCDCLISRICHGSCNGETPKPYHDFLALTDIAAPQADEAYHLALYLDFDDSEPFKVHHASLPSRACVAFELRNSTWQPLPQRTSLSSVRKRLHTLTGRCCLRLQGRYIPCHY